ncbi:MAG: hypothetical protein LBJ58_06020 [Tannerellaceae bacterium]|nr:hypothetical protein [Tannerellaceae bacterium]
MKLIPIQISPTLLMSVRKQSGGGVFGARGGLIGKATATPTAETLSMLFRRGKKEIGNV